MFQAFSSLFLRSPIPNSHDSYLWWAESANLPHTAMKVVVMTKYRIFALAVKCIHGPEHIKVALHLFVNKCWKAVWETNMALGAEEQMLQSTLHPVY